MVIEKSVFYTTIENQIRSDGSRGLLYDHFDNELDAEEKFHQVAAIAVKSGIPYHSIHVLRSDGVIVEDRVYDRRPSTTTEPEE